MQRALNDLLLRNTMHMFTQFYKYLINFEDWYKNHNKKIKLSSKNVRQS